MTRKLNQAKLHSLLRQSPSLFFAHLFPKIEYIEDFKCPWHLHAISHQLLAMHKGRCRRLGVIKASAHASHKTHACISLKQRGYSHNYGLDCNLGKQMAVSTD